MKAVVVSRKALRDIDEIWDYSAQNWGVDQAERYVQGIEKSIAQIGSGGARTYAVSIGGLSKVTSGKHTIYFRESPATVAIIRILHQSMDTATHL